MTSESILFFHLYCVCLITYLSNIIRKQYVVSNYIVKKNKGKKKKSSCMVVILFMARIRNFINLILAMGC